MKVFLRRIALVFAASFAALLIAAVIGVELDLAKLRPRIESLASDGLGRPVRFEGPLVLVVGIRPSLEAGGIEIANPPGWEGSTEARGTGDARGGLAVLERARLEVALPPLLLRRLVVRELSAEGASIDLAVDSDGRENWTLAADPADDPGEAAAKSADVPPEADPTGLDLFIRSASIHKLLLRDVRLGYRDGRGGETRRFALDELSASAATDEPLELRLRGSVDGIPVRSSLRTGDPDALLEGDAFAIEIETELAGTSIRMSGVLDEHEFDLGDAVRLLFRGVRGHLPDERIGEIVLEIRSGLLDGLDGLIDVALPPLGPYAIEARLQAFGTERYEADLTVSVGAASRLKGKGILELATTPPRVNVSLAAETVQLDDFDVGDWSPFAGGEEGAPVATPAESSSESPGEPPAESTAGGRRAFFNPETLRRVDAVLDVRVGQVLSGEEKLGAAHMGVRLEGGRFALDPFTVEVPGGSVAMTASLAPTAQHTDAAFTLLMERFDFGILARRVDPETEMGGLARLDVALQASGPSARGLMANADGHLDFAVFPHEFEAGIIDLWAVNLLAAAVSAVDDEGAEGERSKLNCVVGIFDLEDGLMRALRLLLDTSRMSVEGHAEVNFDTNEVYVELAPASKRAEFFSLATPVEIDGTIPDFEIGVDAGALVGTVIRFITSVVYVPVKRLLADEPPRDELENCLGALKLREKKKSVLGIF